MIVGNSYIYISERNVLLSVNLMLLHIVSYVLISEQGEQTFLDMCTIGKHATKTMYSC